MHYSLVCIIHGGFFFFFRGEGSYGGGHLFVQERVPYFFSGLGGVLTAAGIFLLIACCFFILIC
jgi:hypothetical protein